MNTLSDSFCVISIVGVVAAAVLLLFVDGDGTDGGVVIGGAVADTVDAAAAVGADGHAVVSYHRTSSFQICIVFVSIDFFMVFGFVLV